MKKVWKFFSSIKLAVILLFTLAATSIIGTIIQQQPHPGIYEKLYGKFWGKIIVALELYDMYHSWWFQALLILFALNLTVCSLDRLPKVLKYFKKESKIREKEAFNEMPIRYRVKSSKSIDEIKGLIKNIIKEHGFRPKIEQVFEDGTAYIFSEKGLINRLGVYATHFSILIILLGGLIGSIWGFSGNIVIVEGEKSRNVTLKGGMDRIILPFEIKCEDFEIQYYENQPNIPKEYISRVEIIENGKVKRKVNIEVNHPLKYKGIYFYQASYGIFSTNEGTLILKAIPTKNGKDAKIINIKVGESKQLDGTTIKLIAFYPDLVIDEHNRPVNRSMEMRNPAALLEVKEEGKKPYRVWIFAFFPNVHMKKDASYVFKFIGFDPLYYTVLQVSKDPGVWLVWIGCILMTLALFLTFFMAHKRVFVWVVPHEKSNEILIAFSSNRNLQAMKKDAEVIYKKIKDAV